jgi:hypothetical protein
VVGALRELLAGGLQLGQIGVVSPYAAQVQVLSELCRSLERGREGAAGGGWSGGRACCVAAELALPDIWRRGRPRRSRRSARGCSK